MGTAAGCLDVDAFQCQTDLNCVLEGVRGRCVFPEQVCAYPDPACVGSAWSTADGRCVTVPDTPSEATDGEDVGSSTDGDPTGGTSGPPPPVDGSSSTGPAPTTDTPPGTSSGGPVGCVGPVDDITPEGVVEVSSVFNDNFQGYLAVDDNFTTSWFSDGPGPNDTPAVFTWSVLQPYCISQITMTGNGLHQNQSFQENFGFESVVVRVFDAADTVVFQQMFSLAMTPDPPMIAFPDVEGVRVELELSDHESSNCGGFSELEIVGN